MLRMKSSNIESLSDAMVRFEKSSTFRLAILRTGFASLDDCALDAREELQHIYSRFFENSIETSGDPEPHAELLNKVSELITALNLANIPSYTEISQLVSVFQELAEIEDERFLCRF